MMVSVIRGTINRWVEWIDSHTIEKVIYVDKEVPVFIAEGESDSFDEDVSWFMHASPKKDNNSTNRKDDNKDEKNYETTIVEEKERKNLDGSTDFDELLDSSLSEYDDSLSRKFIQLATDEVIWE